MRGVRLGLLVLAVAGLSPWGCGGGSPVTPDLGVGVGGSAGGPAAGVAGAGGAVVVPEGGGVGEACSMSDDPCRRGLVCEAGTCEPAGEQELGDPCIIAAECAGDAQCVGTQCVEAGDGGPGESCESDADCQDGLRCALSGISLACVEEGTTDVGGDCTANTDCYAGLSCAGGSCQPEPTGLPIPAVPSFDEVACDDPVESGSVQALFEVPGASGAASSDFFALPFPNDVRLSNGQLDLTGFPTPGEALLGFDPLSRYVDALENEASGWGANPVAIFRFTGPVDWDSFVDSDPLPFFFIDVTPGIDVGEGYGANRGLEVSYHRARTNAVCHNWMAVRRSAGNPLTPGHTYAVWTESGSAQALDGSAIERSPHLEAALSDTSPTDPALTGAWEGLAPLREYIAAPKQSWMKEVSADDILNATVITVEELRVPMADLATTVEQLAPAAVSDWVRCDGSSPSPCPQADGDRACGDGSQSGYDEYHALVTLPVFQEGNPPYLESGGGIASTKVRDERVCMALTVPKDATMPTEGWPLAIYAHGTSGSFRSHVRERVAGELSNVTLEGGETVHFAVLGIDQVQHGPRRGDSTDSPDTLFFNFTNPDAARGNPMQGAADQLALARMAATLDVTAAETGADAIRIDGSRIVFFGHSQGSTHGSLALPYSDVFRGAVLSGNGASIRDSLLTKTRPVDIAGVVPFALGDPEVTQNGTRLAGGQDHPGLTLLSQWIDPADPLHYARAVGVKPPDGESSKHVFMTYGIDDSYTPSKTLRVYATAGRFDEVVPDASASPPDDLDINPGADPLATPAAGNATVDGQDLSLLLRQYGPPEGSDGHFVVFDVDSANRDAVRFLAMAALGEIPQVGQ